MSNSTMNRPNMASSIYTNTLSAAYQKWFYITDPDIATQNDPLAWEKVRRDASIAHAIQRRRHAAAGLDWQILPASDEPEDERCAEIMTELVTGIRRFQQARYNLAEAIFRGSSWGYIEGTRRAVRLQSDTKVRRWWTPVEIKHVDRYRFRIVRDLETSDSEIRTHWDIFNVGEDEWRRLENPEWFIRADFENTESSLGYGRGLLNAIYYWWRAKEVVMTLGLSGIERWCNGLLQVAVDGLRVGSSDRTNDDIVDEWITQLKKNRTEHILVSDKNDEIKVHSGPSQGWQQIMDMLHYIDGSVTQLILSSLLPTGGGDGSGSFARAEVEADTSESIFQADRRALSEDIQASLIRQVWRLNQIQIRTLLAEEGLPPAAREPVFRIHQNRNRDPQIEGAVIAQALNNGIPLLRTEVYERLGFSMPAQDGSEDVIEAPSQAPGLPGMPFELEKVSDGSTT
jgi:hypothetical protein